MMASSGADCMSIARVSNIPGSDLPSRSASITARQKGAQSLIEALVDITGRIPGWFLVGLSLRCWFHALLCPWYQTMVARTSSMIITAWSGAVSLAP